MAAAQRILGVTLRPLCLENSTDGSVPSHQCKVPIQLPEPLPSLARLVPVYLGVLGSYLSGLGRRWITDKAAVFLIAYPLPGFQGAESNDLHTHLEPHC